MTEADIIDQCNARGIEVNYHCPTLPREPYYVQLYSVPLRQHSKRAHDGTRAGREAALRLCFAEYPDDGSDLF